MQTKNKPRTSARATIILRRLGRAYLILTGFLYLFAGLIGLFPSSDFVGSIIWDSRLIIKPFPVFPLLVHWVSAASFSIHGFLYNSTLEPNMGQFQAFSLVVVVLSLVAMWSAFAMKQRNRTASIVWLVLIVSSFFAAMANVAADLADWGVYPYAGDDVSRRSIVYIRLSISYLLAYILAGMGLAPVKRPANTSFAN